VGERGPKEGEGKKGGGGHDGSYSNACSIWWVFLYIDADLPPEGQSVRREKGKEERGGTRARDFFLFKEVPSLGTEERKLGGSREIEEERLETVIFLLFCRTASPEGLFDEMDLEVGKKMVRGVSEEIPVSMDSSPTSMSPLYGAPPLRERRNFTSKPPLDLESQDRSRRQKELEKEEKGRKGRGITSSSNSIPRPSFFSTRRTKGKR